MKAVLAIGIGVHLRRAGPPGWASRRRPLRSGLAAVLAAGGLEVQLFGKGRE